MSDTTCSVLFNINIIYQPQSTGTFVVSNTVCFGLLQQQRRRRFYPARVFDCQNLFALDPADGRSLSSHYLSCVNRQPNTFSYRVIYFPLIFLSQSRTGTANPRPCGKFDIFRMCVEREDACLPATGTSQHRRPNSTRYQ